MKQQCNLLYSIHRKFVFIHSFLLFLLLAGGWICAEDPIPAKGTASYFSQHDPRWNGAVMGDGTIDVYGCLVSSLSMMLSTQDSAVNPGKLNDFIRKKDGYTNGNAIRFDVINSYPSTSLEFYSFEIFSLAGLKDYLDEGFEVIVGFPEGAHWVYILGYQGDGSSLSLYTCHDPGVAGAFFQLSSSRPPAEMRVFRNSNSG